MPGPRSYVGNVEAWKLRGVLTTIRGRCYTVFPVRRDRGSANALLL